MSEQGVVWQPNSMAAEVAIGQVLYRLSVREYDDNSRPRFPWDTYRWEAAPVRDNPARAPIALGSGYPSAADARAAAEAWLAATLAKYASEGADVQEDDE